jgi:hypothetical protein
MNFDNVRVEIRPRSPFEAIDLGFVMARHWFFPLWIMWLSVAVPFSMVAHLVLYKHLVIAGVLIWWLKPVYEKPLVFWLSRAFFNEKTGYKDIVRQYFKIIKPRLLADLTYLRFTPNRSFFMPVSVLENLNSKAHSSRVKILGHNQSAGLGLTVVCIIFNMILNVSMLLVAFFILPEELRWTSFEDLLFSQGMVEAVFVKIIALLAMSIIAPFYVAAGFALYINRRTELEAWDIEISFKRLMARKVKNEKMMAKRIRKTISTSMVLFFLTAGSLFISSNSSEAYSAGNISKKEASSIINKVVDHDDFGKKKTVTSWKLKEFDRVDFELPQWLKDFFESFGGNVDWVQNIPKFTGIILEILAWLVGGVAIVFILYKIAQNKKWFQHYAGNNKKMVKATPELFGLSLEENSLPDDIVSKARELLKNNEIRKALSLLYRGTLIKLINDFNIAIPKSATENECVRLVTLKREERETKLFKALTRAWLAMAYGHIIPEKQIIETICHEWQFIYSKNFKG